MPAVHEPCYGRHRKSNLAASRRENHLCRCRCCTLLFNNSVRGKAYQDRLAKMNIRASDHGNREMTFAPAPPPSSGVVSPVASSAHLLLSVVSPVYNEEGGIDHLVTEVIAALAHRAGPWEMVIVNDGSRDGTLDKILGWHRRDSRIKVLDLSRNFGHQRALFAGLAHASGDVIACIDGDLQDPPELIPLMLRELDDRKADVVYGVRRRRKENMVKKTAYWSAYRVMRRVMEIELPLDSGDFAVMRRPVLEAVLRMPEQSLFLRGLRAWVGFQQIPFEYDRAARFAGDAKYTWNDLFRLAHNGIFSFTKLPIRLLGFVGMGAIAISFLYALYLLAAWLGGQKFPQGFTTLVLAIIFFNGIQLVALRILGAYVHRIYDEVRSRPLYVVRAFWNDTTTPS